MAEERKLKYSVHNDPIHDQVSSLPSYLCICSSPVLFIRIIYVKNKQNLNDFYVLFCCKSSMITHQKQKFGEKVSQILLLLILWILIYILMILNQTKLTWRSTENRKFTELFCQIQIYQAKVCGASSQIIFLRKILVCKLNVGRFVKWEYQSSTRAKVPENSILILRAVAFCSNINR